MFHICFQYYTSPLSAFPSLVQAIFTIIVKKSITCPHFPVKYHSLTECAISLHNMTHSTINLLYSTTIAPVSFLNFITPSFLILSCRLSVNSCCCAFHTKKDYYQNVSAHFNSSLFHFILYRTAYSTYPLDLVQTKYKILMMEQSDTCKAHGHTVFIASFNDLVISDRATWLSHILHAALMGSLNIISKREERI